ncbi:MAG: isocitrate lyase/phosphoenolpyruvate mutase family protein [Gemmatimonadaceae bacterium]|nr:isocitrate lyase/phosphoenolpyruvate mutase family protein [Gemmatimonadaceae bacterium]NUQ92551.1 isocitrate lyase/phosphoenolpyruvate mutase family protein [Gemmatimonadaceae bacterium]NUS99080.1 isocitrate lyase/phosphoenolpyruvate mutase family protein [Gemmatimonadaceae bacterium]
MPPRPAHATALARLHHAAEPLVVLNAWDAGSASVAERVGARCVGTTSAGVAAALGFQDGERIPRDLMLAAVERIAAATSLPVTADLEGGYGATPEQVAETIRLALEIGVAGFNLEDSFPAERRAAGGPPLRAIAEQVERLRAAREACDALGVRDAVINARVDVFLREIGEPEARLDLALERAAAYVEAGASCLFPIMLKDRDTIGAFVKGAGAPVNILWLPGVPPLGTLAALGVRRVSLGGGWYRCAMSAAESAAKAVIDEGKLERIWER